jgi:hypothetical protein
MQLVTTASLERVAAAHPAGRAEVIRYRPNVVIDTMAGLSGFIENDWAGHRLHLGPDVILDVVIPSPRCAVPTLRHGDLPVRLGWRGRASVPNSSASSQNSTTSTLVNLVCDADVYRPFA